MNDLHRMLKKSGITHQELADECGLSRAYVTRQLVGIDPLQPNVEAAADELLQSARAQQARLVRDLLRVKGEEDAAEVVDRVCC